MTNAEPKAYFDCIDYQLLKCYLGLVSNMNYQIKFLRIWVNFSKKT